MSQHALDHIAGISAVVCWVVVGLTWLVGALYNQSNAPAERSRTRYVYSLWPIMVITYVLSVAVPKAEWTAVTFTTPWIRLLGLAILLAATALTLWARFALGVMWSSAPTVKQEHELRTSGPYGITRHPIYTGLLGMMLGALLLNGGGNWIVPFPICLVFLQFKINTEERLMLAEFPDAYPSYRQHVPRLVPGGRLLARRA